MVALISGCGREACRHSFADVAPAWERAHVARAAWRLEDAAALVEAGVVVERSAGADPAIGGISVPHFVAAADAPAPAEPGALAGFGSVVADARPRVAPAAGSDSVPADLAVPGGFGPLDSAAVYRARLVLRPDADSGQALQCSAQDAFHSALVAADH
jgi:hypothetical protein